MFADFVERQSGRRGFLGHGQIFTVQIGQGGYRVALQEKEYDLPEQICENKRQPCGAGNDQRPSGGRGPVLVFRIWSAFPNRFKQPDMTYNPANHGGQKK